MIIFLDLKKISEVLRLLVCEMTTRFKEQCEAEVEIENIKCSIVKIKLISGRLRTDILVDFLTELEAEFDFEIIPSM